MTRGWALRRATLGVAAAIAVAAPALPSAQPSAWVARSNSRLLQLRTDAERAMGARFDALQFHDFVLGQGLLPPALLRKAVMQDFVPSASR